MYQFVKNTLNAISYIGRRAGVVALLCLGASHADALEPIVSDDDAPRLTPHEAEYNVKISGIGGVLTTRLALDSDGRYNATHTVRPTGLARLIAGRGRIAEQSLFHVESGALVPHRYQSNDQLSREKGTIDLTFDVKAQRLEGVVSLDDAAEAAVDEAMTDPLFDRVSFQYQLMLDLLIEAKGSDASSSTAQDTYVIFDADGNKTLEITRIGERMIRFRGDTLSALGVRQQSPGSSRKTELWLAPALDFAPTLIEQYRKEKLKLRAVLRDYAPLAVSARD